MFLAITLGKCTKEMERLLGGKGAAQLHLMFLLLLPLLLENGAMSNSA